MERGVPFVVDQKKDEVREAEWLAFCDNIDEKLGEMETATNHFKNRFLFFFLMMFLGLALLFIYFFADAIVEDKWLWLLIVGCVVGVFLAGILIVPEFLLHRKKSLVNLEEMHKIYKESALSRHLAMNLVVADIGKLYIFLSDRIEGAATSSAKITVPLQTPISIENAVTTEFSELSGMSTEELKIFSGELAAAMEEPLPLIKKAKMLQYVYWALQIIWIIYFAFLIVAGFDVFPFASVLL